MKRILSLLAILALALMIPLSASAEAAGQSYHFSLTANGKESVTAAPGDIITVTFTLTRTEGGDDALMYAMQNEIEYDASFFELVEGSEMLADGIQSTLLNMRDGSQRLYMNYLSLAGGTSWPADLVVGSFQLKITAESGVGLVSNQNHLVSNPDGTDHYPAEVADLQVVVSTECKVHFESNGGTPVPDQRVLYGERVVEPDAPQREGMAFGGWYGDLDLTDPWDFDERTVDSDTTLYGGWAEELEAVESPLAGPQDEYAWWLWLLAAAMVLLVLAIILLLRNRRTVLFETDGGSPVKKHRVRRGAKLKQPTAPSKGTQTFAGWYKDKDCTTPWDFDGDAVKNDMTLYGRWKD